MMWLVGELDCLLGWVVSGVVFDKFEAGVVGAPEGAHDWVAAFEDLHEVVAVVAVVHDDFFGAVFCFSASCEAFDVEVEIPSVGVEVVELCWRNVCCCIHGIEGSAGLVLCASETLRLYVIL